MFVSTMISRMALDSKSTLRVRESSRFKSTIDLLILSSMHWGLLGQEGGCFSDTGIEFDYPGLAWRTERSQGSTWSMKGEVGMSFEAVVPMPTRCPGQNWRSVGWADSHLQKAIKGGGGWSGSR